MPTFYKYKKFQLMKNVRENEALGADAIRSWEQKDFQSKACLVLEQVQGQPAQLSRPSLKARNKGGAVDTAHCGSACTLELH